MGTISIFCLRFDGMVQTKFKFGTELISIHARQSFNQMK